MIIDIIKTLLMGMSVGFQAFFSALSVYQQLNDLKTTIIAAAIGVPTIVLSIAGIIYKIVKIISKHS